MQFLFKNTNLKAEIFDRKYTFSSEEILNKKNEGPRKWLKKATTVNVRWIFQMAHLFSPYENEPFWNMKSLKIP